MSSYIEKTLGDDEEILYRANFNWTFSFWPALWFLISLTPVIVLGYAQFIAPDPAQSLRIGWYIFGIGLLFGFWHLLSHLIILWTTEIAVTTYRFVYKKGLISRDSQEVSLNKIEEITLKQSIWGRIFGYGALILRGTGVGVIELPNIDEPIKVRRIIENAKASLRRGGRPDGDVIPDDDD